MRFGAPRDASVSAGGAPLVLLRAGRLRAQDREHRGRPEPEEIRAGLQGCREPGQPGLRPGQVQAERHLRNAQGQRHPDGSVGVRGPHLQPGRAASITADLPHEIGLYWFFSVSGGSCMNDAQGAPLSAPHNVIDN